MDPHRDTSVTSRRSQLRLLDEWLKVVYGLRLRLPLPITKSEPSDGMFPAHQASEWTQTMAFRDVNVNKSNKKKAG